jgi:uncharacterized protein YxjI
MTHVTSFYVKQKITVMVNQYRVIERLPDGGEGRLLAFAQQKRMSFKEKVFFYADEAKTEELFSFKARQGLDVRAEHDVFDQEGNAIGWFKKDFVSSLMRSTWHLRYDDVEALGQERNATVAVVRRIWDWIPVLGEVWVPFLFHFDFVDSQGTVVMSSERKAQIRDVYTVAVPDERLDFRVAASMAVALDALQSR